MADNVQGFTTPRELTAGEQRGVPPADGAEVWRARPPGGQGAAARRRRVNPMLTVGEISATERTEPCRPGPRDRGGGVGLEGGPARERATARSDVVG
jgi:hypothetical protein